MEYQIMFEKYYEEMIYKINIFEQLSQKTNAEAISVDEIYASTREAMFHEFAYRNQFSGDICIPAVFAQGDLVKDRFAIAWCTYYNFKDLIKDTVKAGNEAVYAAYKYREVAWHPQFDDNQSDIIRTARSICHLYVKKCEESYEKWNAFANQYCINDEK